MTAVSNALVIGGGIGGLTAAIALRQQGVEVDLIEIAPDLSVYGVGIIQPNNTLRALSKIGLADACVEAGGAFEGWKLFTGDGHPIMEAPNTSDAAPGYPPVNGITRPKLHKILVDAAEREGARIGLANSATALEDDGERVHVAFADGTEGEYDLVVACDGMRSRTRKMLFPHSAEPEFTGQGVWRYNLPKPEGMDWGHIYFGPDTKVGLVPMSGDLMYMFVVTEEPGNPRHAGDGLADTLRERLAGYETGEVARLRALCTDPEAVVYRPMETLLMDAPWHRGRTIVIGDAAHATTPHLAQGAAMAIEDAVLIGELMGRDQPVEDLFAEFMDRRFERAASIYRNSTQIGAWEMEQWRGVQNPEARPGELLHESTMAMMAAY